MLKYIMQATLNGSITTQLIEARDNAGAKVIVAQKINQNYKSDKRYAIGEITLKDPKGKIIYLIPQEEEKGGV